MVEVLDFGRRACICLRLPDHVWVRLPRQLVVGRLDFLRRSVGLDSEERERVSEADREVARLSPLA